MHNHINHLRWLQPEVDPQMQPQQGVEIRVQLHVEDSLLRAQPGFNHRVEIKVIAVAEQEQEEGMQLVL